MPVFLILATAFLPLTGEVSIYFQAGFLSNPIKMVSTFNSYYLISRQLGLL